MRDTYDTRDRQQHPEISAWFVRLLAPATSGHFATGPFLHGGIPLLNELDSTISVAPRRFISAHTYINLVSPRIIHHFQERNVVRVATSLHDSDLFLNALLCTEHALFATVSLIVPPQHLELVAIGIAPFHGLHNLIHRAASGTASSPVIRHSLLLLQSIHRRTPQHEFGES